MASISDITKRGRGRPATGLGSPTLVRLQPDMAGRIDRWAEKSGEELSRPEAIRRLVELGLKVKR